MGWKNIFLNVSNYIFFNRDKSHNSKLNSDLQDINTKLWDAMSELYYKKWW